MAHLKIPQGYDKTKVLLVDDEPEHLEWLIDYLKGKGYTSVVTTNVRDALNAIESTTFRAYVIDLNIPFGGWVPRLGARSGAFTDYHGLYVLQLVRSQGNDGTRVLAYSAHSNEQIEAEIKRLYCTYIVKGRPREFKKEIDLVLQHDPKANKQTGRKPKVKQ